MKMIIVIVNSFNLARLAFGAQAEVGNLGYTKFGFNVSKKDRNIGWLIGYDLIQANNKYT